jgi:hypothetical protein
LALSTPVSPSGSLYLIACVLIVFGALSAPWRQRHYRGIARLGMALVLAVVSVRIAFPSPGTTLQLTTLPAQPGSRWLNRLFDEQDIVLFGERFAFQIGGMISTREGEQLLPILHAAYQTMKLEGATPLSPFMATYLNQQSPASFDAVIAEPLANSIPTSGVIFLHGFAGNFTLQCWLVARAAQSIGAITVCPSVGWEGDWWTSQGEATVKRTLDYLQERRVRRIYLAGLSNGGVGVSYLGPRLRANLKGLILISGADPDAPMSGLPVLVVHSTHDERIPIALAQRYAQQAGNRGIFYELDGDHFVLVKRADAARDVIAAWLALQEQVAEGS